VRVRARHWYRSSKGQGRRRWQAARAAVPRAVPPHVGGPQVVGEQPTARMPEAGEVRKVRFGVLPIQCVVMRAQL
jgi:hypothetical protein